MRNCCGGLFFFSFSFFQHYLTHFECWTVHRMLAAPEVWCRSVNSNFVRQVENHHQILCYVIDWQQYNNVHIIIYYYLHGNSHAVHNHIFWSMILSCIYMVKISDIFKLTDSRICVGHNGVFYFFPPSLLCSVLFLFGGKLQNTTTRFLVGNYFPAWTHFSKMFLCFFFLFFFLCWHSYWTSLGFKSPVTRNCLRE